MSRFAVVSEQELTEIERSSLSKQTHYNDAYVWNLILAYCKENNVEVTARKEDMDILLTQFLASVRTKKGELFCSGTLTNIYHALSRNILSKFGFDIRQEPTFTKTERMLKNMKALSKRNGKGNVVHTDVISQTDMQKISSLQCISPVTLQWKVWLLCHFHFAKRGCENGDNMLKGDIIFKQNENGDQYIILKDKLTKNHREDDSSSSYGGVLMSDNSDNCPVKVVKLYLNKLNPNNGYLWQRPRSTFLENEPSWFCDMKIGINKYRNFMSEISAYLNLSKRYTNHALRATAITALGEQYEDTDVKSVSGHKSTASLSTYKTTSLQKKINMSQYLNKRLHTESSSSSLPISRILSEPASAEVCGQILAKHASSVICEQNLIEPTSSVVCGQIHAEPTFSAVCGPIHAEPTSLVVNDAPKNTIQDINVEPPAMKKPCLAVNGNNFSFSGSNCTINVNFQTSQ
jgi:hypothetical protein